MRHLRNLASLVITTGLLVAASPAHGFQTAVPATPMGGAKVAKRISPQPAAPDFVSVDLSGKEVKLSDFAGKVVILDFWATWCGPCKQSFPHTQELASQYEDQGVVVLAVCTSDTRAKYEEWTRKNQTEYRGIRFTHDPAERKPERASSKLYDVPGIPAQFVITRDGKLAGRIIGFNGAKDARTEAVLAKAGVQVDPELIKAGNEQLRRDAEAEAAQLAEEAANPRPLFRPQLGVLKSGDEARDFSLQGPDGEKFALSSLRGNTVVMGFGFEDVVPADTLRSIGKKYGSSGVVPLGVMIYSKREAYDSWLAKHDGKPALRSGWDPAGTFPGDPQKPNMAARTVWDGTTALRKFDGLRPMSGSPGFPFFVVVDPAGKFVGMFSRGKDFDDALGNLLLRAGVKLSPADMPTRLSKDADFAVEPPPPPKPPEAFVERLAIGAEAPDFTTTDAGGNTVKLSDYAGKVVVLDFWATWCGPCIASMPHTQQVAADYKDQGVVVIGSCTSDKRKAFESWVRKNQPKYPDFVFAHDAAEKSPERASHKLYGVRGIPAQFVIGRDGKVAAFVSGYRKGEVLLEGALAKAGIEVAPEILAKAAEDQKKRDTR